MSGNKNRKLLKENKKHIKKQLQMNARYDKFVLFLSAFILLFYAFLFFSNSFITSSPRFSVILALLSFSVTLSFEIKEWCTYFQTYKNKTIKLFDFIPTLLFVNLLFIPLLCIYSFIEKYIDMPKFFSSSLPDTITVISLVLYFLSYIYRTLKTM